MIRCIVCTEWIEGEQTKFGILATHPKCAPAYRRERDLREQGDPMDR